MRTELASALVAASVLGVFASLSPARADVVYNDNVIINVSLCVGIDCVNGENFGADTIRLKENNLRIHFDDTSISGSFPANDWRIVANDQQNGGANYLGFEDSTAGRMVFSVEAGAPANSLYVDDGGRVGLGTSQPATEMHIVDGDTPTVRLQQDGSSGFAPQVWDVAGNEAGFFVRDLTNGSLLPFRILPGAPSQSLVVDGDGEVSIGAGLAPEAPLHVRRPGSSAGDVLVVENMGGNPSVLLKNSGNGRVWEMTAGINYIVREDGGANLMTLSSGGNLTIAGELTTSGTCSVGCDRVFDVDYELPTISEHAEAMWANKHLPAVGPTIEGKPMNLTRKVEGLLNELEKAHIYIAQLEKQVSAIPSLEARLSALEESR